MNNKSKAVLMTRVTSDSHKSLLANQSRTSHHVRKLIEQVYTHQPAVYYRKDKPNFVSQSIKIAEAFYSMFYSTPEITRGTTSEGVALDPDTFIQEVIIGDIKPRRNSFPYLLGQVGVGRTAFINKLISTYAHEWLEKDRWFVEQRRRKSILREAIAELEDWIGRLKATGKFVSSSVATPPWLLAGQVNVFKNRVNGEWL